MAPPPAASSAARGRLALFLPGLGAVTTTTMAGIMLARRGIAPPIGALSQLEGIGGHAFSEGALASLADIELASWDIFHDNALEAARRADVISEAHLAPIADELAAVTPMAGAFFQDDVPRLRATHQKPQTNRAALCEAIREDIRRFLLERGCQRGVAVWCGSTERHRELTRVHESVSAFEAGLASNDESITATQLYAWAFLKERVPFANASPNHAVDFPAALELAREMRVAVAGKDLKTGQTMLKTAIAPALAARSLGVRGWYSANILGNRDGEVLDDEGACLAKERSKSAVLETLLDAERSPELYGELVHKVRIDYHPPRGDAKESWDSIDLFGWLGYPMQLKVNFLARDSILAAPVVLDLALFLDLAQRSGGFGAQEWLGFDFKDPLTSQAKPEHDLFVQYRKLAETLKHLA